MSGLVAWNQVVVVGLLAFAQWVPDGLCFGRCRWDYNLETELGHGNFSRVYRVTHRLTGLPYAVKTNRTPIQTLQARNMWLNVSGGAFGREGARAF